MNDAPNPCPFCGSSRCFPRGEGSTLPKDWYVQCENCASDGPYGHDRAEAITLWNRRAHDCTWPLCQSAEVQDRLAAQVHRELYSGEEQR